MEAVFDRLEATIVSKGKCISCYKEAMCICVHIFILKMAVILALKHHRIVFYIFSFICYKSYKLTN